jgi:hypothetical protein
MTFNCRHNTAFISGKEFDKAASALAVCPGYVGRPAYDGVMPVVAFWAVGRTKARSLELTARKVLQGEFKSSAFPIVREVPYHIENQKSSKFCGFCYFSRPVRKAEKCKSGFYYSPPLARIFTIRPFTGLAVPFA